MFKRTFCVVSWFWLQWDCMIRLMNWKSREIITWRRHETSSLLPRRGRGCWNRSRKTTRKLPAWKDSQLSPMILTSSYSEIIFKLWSKLYCYEMFFRTNEFREKIENIEEEIRQLDLDIEENQGIWNKGSTM